MRRVKACGTYSRWLHVLRTGPAPPSRWVVRWWWTGSHRHCCAAVQPDPRRRPSLHPAARGRASIIHRPASLSPSRVAAARIWPPSAQHTYGNRTEGPWRTYKRAACACILTHAPQPRPHGDRPCARTDTGRSTFMIVGWIVCAQVAAQAGRPLPGTDCIARVVRALLGLPAVRKKPRRPQALHSSCHDAAASQEAKRPGSGAQAGARARGGA